jgi:hypothetical protein
VDISGRPNTSFGRIFGRIVSLNRNLIFDIGNATETKYPNLQFYGIFHFCLVQMVLLLIFWPILSLWRDKAHLRFCVKISGASHSLS